MISIALADDEMLFRKGIRMILEEVPDFEIVMEAGNGAEVMERLNIIEEVPHVLLLDLEMPIRSGLDIAPEIREKYPEIRVVILSSHFHRSYIIHMIEQGASAYLAKNSEPGTVTTTIREVVSKGFYYSGETMMAIRDHMTNGSKRNPLLPGQELSNRELEVLQLICEQYTTAEIAERLFISPRTVDGHRNRLLEKTDSRNTAGLVIYAIQNELVPLKPRF